MARFKPVHRGLKLLPIDFDKQVQPASGRVGKAQRAHAELNQSGRLIIGRFRRS